MLGKYRLMDIVRSATHSDRGCQALQIYKGKCRNGGEVGCPDWTLPVFDFVRQTRGRKEAKQADDAEQREACVERGDRHGSRAFSGAGIGPTAQMLQEQSD